MDVTARLCNRQHKRQVIHDPDVCEDRRQSRSNHTPGKLLIASVQGYTSKETRHIDEKRRAEGLKKRKGAKKAEAVVIPEDIAQVLKQQPNTPQGRRDALIMCLLLDHGLRMSEIGILARPTFDPKAGTFTFYRPKVNKTQTHTITADTRRAAGQYLTHDAPTRCN